MSMAGGWNEVEFASIFREHYQQILRVVRRVVGSNAEAEEVCAEVFWRLYRAGGQTATQGAVAGWLYRTATHAAIDLLRAGKRRGADESLSSVDPEDRGDGPLSTLLRSEQIHEVRAILARLDVEKAQILLLRHGGLSYAEIADAIGVKSTSVGTMLSRAEEEFCMMYQRQGLRNRSRAALTAAREER